MADQVHGVTGRARPSRSAWFWSPLCAAVLILAAAARAQQTPPGGPVTSATPPAAAPATFPLTAYAAVGSSLAQGTRIAEMGWSDEQLAAFLDGVRAAIQGRAIPLDDPGRRLFDEMGRRVGEFEARDKQSSTRPVSQPGQIEQYMKEARKRFSLQVTESGLGYAVHPGRGGARPRPGDTVVVTCVATAADGTTNVPQLAANHVRAKMSGLLPGFMEGLQMMTVDSEAIFVLPPSLSFGEGRWPEGVERGSPLIFRVTLHEVISEESLR
jgi:FKBP-type peptidyl-prolyl cis-trans isomerase